MNREFIISPPLISPPLSIVIPIRNGALALGTLLEKIFSTQTPRHLFEVWVVDNNSTEDIEAVTKRWGAYYLKEERLQSPAAARNKGIQNARGEVIALVDSDCVPMADWVSGVMQVLNEGDLIAGAVQFSLSPKRRVTEICDSITYLQQEEVVKKRNLAFTTHLVVKRKVFDSVGLFDTKLFSSEDIEFVRRAVAGGFKLKFTSEIAITHPARKGTSLLKKAFRIGYGKGQLKRFVTKTNEVKESQAIWKRPQVQNLLPSILTHKLKRVGIRPTFALILSLQSLLIALLSLNALGALFGMYFPRKSN